MSSVAPDRGVSGRVQRDFLSVHWSLQRLLDLSVAARFGEVRDTRLRAENDIIAEIRSLAFSSLNSGCRAYGCLCLDLAERMENLNCDGGLWMAALAWLRHWLELSIQYWSDKPASTAADALIERLDDPLWDSRFDSFEKGVLVRAAQCEIVRANVP